MDLELKAYLDEMRLVLGSNAAASDIRIGEKIEGLETNHNGEIEGLETRLDGKIEELEGRLVLLIHSTKAELRTHTEEVETRLLSEFWKWAQTTEARYR